MARSYPVEVKQQLFPVSTVTPPFSPAVTPPDFDNVAVALMPAIQQMLNIDRLSSSSSGTAPK